MEPLLHFTIVFMLLFLSGVPFRKYIFASSFTLLPDLDALFFIHRWLTHSIIVILAIGIPVLILARKTVLRDYVALGLIGAALHPIFDLFNGYTPILWPLHNKALWVKTELIVHLGGHRSLSLALELLQQPVSFQPFQSLDAPLFTSQGLIVSLALFIPLVLGFLRKKRAT